MHRKVSRACGAPTLTLAPGWRGVVSVCLYHAQLDQARQAGFLIKFMGPLARGGEGQRMLWPEIKKVGLNQPGDGREEVWVLVMPEATGATGSDRTLAIRDWLFFSVLLQIRGFCRDLPFWLLTSASCPLTPVLTVQLPRVGQLSPLLPLSPPQAVFLTP